MKSLKRAIAIVGSADELGQKLGITRQAVEKWQRKRIPADRAVEIERIVKGAVMRHELRPDLYEGYALIADKATV